MATIDLRLLVVICYNMILVRGYFLHSFRDLSEILGCTQNTMINEKYECQCLEGFAGNPYAHGESGCKKISCGAYDKCANNAKCVDEKCVCNPPLVGDGVQGCYELCTCEGSGDPHYYTFDRQKIDFMGGCKYILAEGSGGDNNPCDFRIEGKNDKFGVVSYNRLLDVKILGKTIRMTKSMELFIDGVRKYVPFTYNSKNEQQFSVTLSGDSLRLDTRCGMVVRISKSLVIEIRVPKFDNLKGICGDCNGKQDDYRTKNGTDVSLDPRKFSLIGNSYEVVDDSDSPGKGCKIEPDLHPCDKLSVPNLRERAETKSACRHLNLKNKDTSMFGKCLEKDKKRAQQMFESCVFDFCSYFDKTTELVEVLCKTISGFADECQKLGLTIQWRNKYFCPMKCQENAEFKPSMTACPDTCTTPTASETCTLNKREGCACKPGYILSDVKCVKVEECGCTDQNGGYFPFGTRIVSDDCLTVKECNMEYSKVPTFNVVEKRKCGKNTECKAVDGELMCVCKTGYFGKPSDGCEEGCGGYDKCANNAKCVDEKCVCNPPLIGDGVQGCYKLCACEGSGDPHYYTFDRQRINFMGGCKYILAEGSGEDNNPCDFRIEGKNDKFGVVSYNRLLDVKILEKTIRMTKNMELFIDGVRKYVPFTYKSKDEQQFSVTLSGDSLRLDTRCGMVVRISTSLVIEIRVPKFDNLKGICGDCNGKQDDYRTKNGTDVSLDPRKFSLIGNSYEVVDDSDSPGKGCKIEPDLHPCDKLSVPNLRERAETKSACRHLNLKNKDTSMFGKCLEKDKKRAQQMFESCVFDYCSYFDKTTELVEVLCKAISGFADECQKLGLTIQWRSKYFCPMKCQENAEFMPSMTACPDTCTTPTASETCTLNKREGCACKPGYILSDVKCVTVEECGCTDQNGGYFPFGTRIVSDDCLTVKECNMEYSKVPTFNLVEKRKCGKNTECKAVNGELTCVCKTGYIGKPSNGCEEGCGIYGKCATNAKCIYGKCVCNAPLVGDGVSGCHEVVLPTTSWDCVETTSLMWNTEVYAVIEERCEFYVRLFTVSGKLSAKIRIENKTFRLKDGQNLKRGCGSFTIRNPKIIIEKATPCKNTLNY